MMNKSMSWQTHIGVLQSIDHCILEMFEISRIERAFRPGYIEVYPEANTSGDHGTSSKYVLDGYAIRV